MLLYWICCLRGCLSVSDSQQMLQLSHRWVSLLYSLPLWWCMGVSGIKYPIKSNAGQEGFIQAYNSRGRESIMSAKSCSRQRSPEGRSRSPTRHTSSILKKQSTNQSKTIWLHNSSQVTSFFQQGAAYWRFHNLCICATHWRLGVQTMTLSGNTSYANHKNYSPWALRFGRGKLSHRNYC